VFRLDDEDTLVDAVVVMFKHLRLLDTFKLSEATLRTFISSLRDSYQPNPYHNFVHAVDVTQAMFVTLSTMQLKQYLRPVDVYALMVASLCHDSDHPGFTNAYLIATKSPLAEGCSDASVLEHHHVKTSLDLIFANKPNLLSGLTRDEAREFKSVFETTILATDMAKHNVSVTTMCIVVRV
jgi:hypothetical protein